MTLEDMSPFYGTPTPSNFIVSGAPLLSDRSSILSAKANNVSPVVNAAPITRSRRVRKVAGPSVTPTSYFSKESSGASYFVDDYFGIS